MLLSVVGARAQFTVSERYYVNKAKAELKAEEDAKETKVIVVGAKKGILSYVIRDGKRTDYLLDVVPKAKPKEYSYLVWKMFEFPKNKVSTPEEPKVDEDAFAELLQELYADGWSMVMSYGTSSGEVYIFEKRVAKAKSRLK